MVKNVILRCDPKIGNVNIFISESITASFTQGSGNSVLGTCVGHGLVTGQVISLSGSVYSGLFKVTVLSADTFTLDDTTFTSNESSLAVSRCRGYSWSDPIGNGAFPLSLDSGQNNKIVYEKAPEPTSLGNVTWTTGSFECVLSTARTINIDMCESGWTAVIGTIAYNNTSIKEGTNNMAISLPANYALNSKICYKSFTADLSTMDAISFWMLLGASITNRVTDKFRVCLCSDTAGNVIVDSFQIDYPDTTMGARTIKRTGGGNLGSNIQSIAIYSGSGATETSTRTLRFDDIFACKYDDIHLNSLISKDDAWGDNAFPKFPIKYIRGTTVGIAAVDGVAYVHRDNAGTYECFCFNPIILVNAELTNAAPLSYLQYAPIGANTNADNYVTYEGGWDKALDQQTGYSCFIRPVSMNVTAFLATAPSTNYRFTRIGTCRFLNYLNAPSTSTYTRYKIDDLPCATEIAGAFIATQAGEILLGNINSLVTYPALCQGNGSYTYSVKMDGNAKIHNARSIMGSYNMENMNDSYIRFGKIRYVGSTTVFTTTTGRFPENVTIEFDEIDWVNNRNGSAFDFSGTCSIPSRPRSLKLIGGTISNANYGVYAKGGVLCNNITFTQNNVGSVFPAGRGNSCGLEFINCSFLDSTEVNFSSTNTDSQNIVTSNHHDKVAGTFKLFSKNFTLTKNAGDTYYAGTILSASPAMWASFPVSQFAYNAGSQVTVTLEVDTQGDGANKIKLRIPAGEITGVGQLESNESAVSTSGYQTLTLQFTPTLKGTCNVQCLLWLPSTANGFKIKSINVSQ